MSTLPEIMYVFADIAEDGSIAVVAMIDDPQARDICHALVFLRDGQGTWSGQQLSNRLVGIHVGWSDSEPRAVGIAIDGGVCALGDGTQTWGLVEAGPDGPNTLVPLTTSRRIGGKLVCAGLQRRVYSGSSSGWSRIDDGCRIEKADASIGGFLCIDGSSPEMLWAAGYGGEIWHRLEGSWRQIDSPTNAKLTLLRCLPEGTVLVGGANGTAFVGDGAAWQVVEGLESYAPIAAESFREKTYIAVRGGALYEFTSAGIERSEACVDFPVYGLATCKTAMLAVGPLGLRLLGDKGWRDILPPIPVRRT